MVPFDSFNLLRRIEIDQMVGESNLQESFDVLEICGGRVLGIAPESVLSLGFQ